MFRRVVLIASTVVAFTAMAMPTAAQTKAAAQPKSNAAPKAAAAPVKATDMALGRLVPEKAMFTMVSNGWKQPTPGSTNKTEKLWAEQSVQDFMQQLTDEIKQTISRQTQGNDEATLAAATIPVLLAAAIEHPLAISLVSFTVNNPPEIKFAAVIDTESDADEVRDAFEKLIAQVPEEGPNSLIEETIEGAKLYRPKISETVKGPFPQFGMFKSYLIFTMGESMAAETIQKINGSGKAPAWFDATLRDLKVDRPSLVWNVDVESIWKTVDPLITDGQVRAGLDASGLMALKRIASVNGLDAVASVDKLIVQTNGAPRGILALLPNKPLTASDLKSIPMNPSSAMVVRFDLDQLVESILKITDAIHPLPRQQFDAFSEQGEQILGFSIKNDFFKAFGDVWSMYISGTEPGGGMVPGAVVSAALKDQQKLIKVQDSIVALVKSQLQQAGPQAPISLQDFTARGIKGYRVQINNLPVPVSPAWVVTKDQFVVGLTPQLVTAHLGAASAKTSFADNEDVKAAIKRDPKLLILTYRDPKPEIQSLYTLVNMFSPILLGQARQFGVDFNLPPLPPFSDIEPHLSPSVGTASQTAQGWQCENHGVIPSMSAGSPAVAAVAVALLLPAVQQAREAARRTQSKNNLKQIGLAMFNYEATYQHFPERVTLDKGGNPGLSWRVKILPFIDQAELYNQFHLDEPWDSEHNKRLIERMPPVYASPNDPELAKQGKTRYIVLDGDGTLFEGEEGPRIASVTDGTSNTIMAVEARSDHAVTWTEPVDLEIDEDDLLAGLESARVGGFHALFADGSVRFISDNIDLGVLKALFTKAGGEAVGDF